MIKVPRLKRQSFVLFLLTMMLASAPALAQQPAAPAAAPAVEPGDTAWVLTSAALVLIRNG